MRRQRLASRSGCLTCRRRRKKCGEEKPICQNCVRLSMNCSWQRSEHSQVPHGASDHEHSVALFGANATEIRRAPALLTHQDGTIANGYHSFMDDTQFYFCLEAAKVSTALFNPLGQLDSTHQSFLTTLVLQEDGLRGALAAFAAQILSRQNHAYREVAMGYYGTALECLRKLISLPMDSHKSTQVIIVAAYLGFTEFYALDEHETSSIHFVTVARLLQTEVGLHNTTIWTNPSLARMIVVLLAYSLWYICESAIFVSELQNILKSIDWKLLHTQLHEMHSKSGFNIVEQKLLELNYGYCLLALQIFDLCRRNGLTPLPEQEMDVLKERLALFDKPSIRTRVAELPPLLQELVIRTSSITVSAVEILVCKMRQPDSCSASPQLRQITADAWDEVVRHAKYSLLQELRPYDVGRLALWPPMVILFATHDLAEFEILAATRPRNGGTGRKLEQVVELIRRRKTESQNRCSPNAQHGCHGIHDGLDFLSHPRGVYGSNITQTPE